jgi:putative acetyltransferase
MEQSALEIRRLSEGDLDAVQDLHVRAFSDLARDWHTPEQIRAHVRAIQHPAYRDELLVNNILCAMGPRDRILGTAGWRPQPDRDDTARIRKVFVDPALARQGLGSRLVRAAENRARAVGFIHFYVRANMNAVALYTRLGYSEIEQGTMTVADGVTLPVMYMEKRAAD